MFSKQQLFTLKLTESHSAKQLFKMQTFILNEVIQSRIGRYIAPIINNRYLGPCISHFFFLSVSLLFRSFEQKEPFLFVDSSIGSNQVEKRRQQQYQRRNKERNSCSRKNHHMQIKEMKREKSTIAVFRSANSAIFN